jgi:hypothetical protein
MEWQSIVALVVIIPVILFPVAFVWYMNLSGVFTALRKRARREATSVATRKA